MINDINLLIAALDFNKSQNIAKLFNFFENFLKISN